MSLAGSTQSLPLADLIQATAYTGRTCCVIIDAGEAGEAALGFVAGELVSARIRGLRGDPAVLALLALPHVTYRLETVRPTDHDVTSSWQHLVLESARRQDEKVRRARRSSLSSRAPTTDPGTGSFSDPDPTPPTSPARRAYADGLSTPIPNAAVPIPVTSAFSGPVPLPLPPPPPALAAPSPSPATRPRPPRTRWVLATAAAAIAAITVLGGTLAIKSMRTPSGAAAPGAAAAAAASPSSSSSAAPPDLTPDIAPAAVDTPLPAPPPGARAGLAPTVVIRMRVEPDGHVGEAHVYRPRADLAAWESAALDAARRWRFTAPRHGGVAVAAWINVPVSFAAHPAAARTITVKGSDTIGGEHGAGPRLAAAFEAAHPDVHVIWEGLGSSTAFVGLLDGSADLGASSRPVKPNELEEAERLGLRFTEYVLGYDGIAVIVHPSSPLRSLTTAQLARIFTGEIRTWNQLLPGAPGTPGTPDRPIRLLARPSYSGTATFFKDKILGGADLPRGTELIEQSEAIAAAVAADPTAISFVGMSWVSPAVRALAVAPADDAPAIAPDAATIRAGTYPIYRPLLLYVRGLPSPAVAELLRFCLGPDGQALVAERGFVPGDTPLEAIVAADPAADSAAPAPTVALRVSFGAGRAILDDDARLALTALAGELRAAPRAITLHGHADAERGAGSNADLARRRAEAVAAFLRIHGVDGRRISVDSAGDAAPVATNTTAAGREQNRRVDVILAP